MGEQEFKAGDTVRVKGTSTAMGAVFPGPHLAVLGKLNNGRIATTWFQDGDWKEAAFRPGVLEKTSS